MAKICQAIIHLRSGASWRRDRARLAPALTTIPGVNRVQVEPAAQSLAIEFDHDRMGLGDLVRAIEDAGARVAGVAQRRLA